MAPRASERKRSARDWQQRHDDQGIQKKPTDEMRPGVTFADFDLNQKILAERAHRYAQRGHRRAR